jgi:hypothetical protein
VTAVALTWAPPGARPTNLLTHRTTGRNASGSSARWRSTTVRPLRGFRPELDDGVTGEVIISVRQIEGDSPVVEVEWPDSTAEFPGVENWTPREAREIGGFMVQAAGLLDGLR